MPSRVQIDLIATDSASPTLDKVRHQLEMFPTFARGVGAVGPEVDKASRSFEGLDISASKATRGIRALAVPLVSELAPALGSTVSSLATVTTGAIALGSGFGAVAIAAAGFAGILGGKLLAEWQRGRQEMEAYRGVLESVDFGRKATLVGQLADKIAELNTKLRELRPAEEAAAGATVFGRPAPQGSAQAESVRRNQAEILRQRALLQTQIDIEQGEQALLSSQAGVKPVAEATARRIFDLEAGQAGLFDFRLDQIEQRFQQQLRDAAKIRQGGSREEAAIAAAQERAAREQRALALGVRFAGAAPVSPFETVEGQEAARRAREAAFVTDEAERQARAREFQTGAPVNPFETESGQELERRAIERRLLGEETEELERQLSITQSIATLNAMRTDLALEQRESLSLQAIEEERILKLKLAQNDAQRLAVETEAQLKRQQVREATDPVAGLKRGIANIEVEFGSAGLRMQSLMQNIGGGMASALDDTFFSVVTGKFQDLPGIAQRFGQDMVRAFTSELSKMATAAIFGQLRSVFEGIFPGGGTPGSAPFGGAGSGGGGGLGGVLGGYDPWQHGYPWERMPTLTESGRPLSQSELATAYAAGGDAGVRALRSGDAAVIGGEFVPAGTLSPEFTQSAYALPATTASRFNLRSGLGIAGSAALLGLTAYGATGATNTAGVVTSAVAGGLTGAALGAQVGGAFGYQTAGAGAGALLGAAIAGTIAYLSKQEADKQRAKERQAAEVARATGAGADLVSSAAGSTSLADFFRRVTAYGSGYTGGTANPAVSVAVQTPEGEKAIGVPNPYYPVATLQDLLAAPGSLRAGIQAGVDPALLAGPNLATSTALQAIARDLVDQFREAEMGVGVTQQDMVGGLTRRTTFPATRADMLDPMLDVEVDELAREAMDPEDRALMDLEIMSRVAVDTDYVSTISDGATGQIVSITRIARSTIPLPGTDPAPGVPPGAVAPIQQVAALNIPRFMEPAPTSTPTYGAVVTGSGEGGPVYGYGITGYTQPTPEELAAYEARKEAFYAPYIQQLAADAQAQLSALTVDQVQAALAAGLFTPETLAVLVQAGLLPSVRALLPPELIAALDAAGGDGAAGSTSTPNSADLTAAISSMFGSLPNVPGSPTSTPMGLAGQLAAWGLMSYPQLSPQTANFIGTAVDNALGLAGPVASAVNFLAGLISNILSKITGIPSTLGLGFPVGTEFEALMQQMLSPEPDFTAEDAAAAADAEAAAANAAAVTADAAAGIGGNTGTGPTGGDAY